MSRAAGLILAATAVWWVALVVAAPLALAHGYALLPTIVYEAAGLICHQRADRSFHLAGVQLPVCARCFGLYASGAAGAVAACFAGLSHTSRITSRFATRAIAAASTPTAATLLLEWSDLLHPSGRARAIAAAPLGMLAGWLFVRLLAREATQPQGSAQVRYHS
jgi:hypothetical protein